jgi:hypothetical protein
LADDDALERERDDLRQTLLPWLRLLACVGFCAASLSQAPAQSALTRSEGSAPYPPFSAQGEPARPTVETASRDAQRAIKDCDDNVAIQCVADALNRYAETLKQIAQAGDRNGSPIPRRRHRREQ